MRTCRLFKRDVMLGIVCRWLVMMIPFVFGIYSGIRVYTLLSDMRAAKDIYTYGTFLDYVMYAMQGMGVYKFDPREYFEVPICWFVFQIGAAYTVAYYPGKDFDENAKTLFVAARSRCAWWTSKVLWCFLSLAIYYVIAYLGMVVVAVICHADMSLKVTQEFAVAVFSPNLFSVSLNQLVLILLVLPFVTTFAVSVLQMLVGFIVSPVISFALVCMMYILSAYYTAWYMLGNYTMWIRSSYINENGVYAICGLVVAAGTLVLSYVAGKIFFDSKDVL